MDWNEKNSEMKDSTSNIFKSTKKEKESQPDFWGKAIVDGVEKTISLWSKKSEKGVVYLTGSIEDFKRDSSSASADEFLSEDKSEGTPF